MYCHGLQLVHVRSSAATAFILNWVSYSSQVAHVGAFWWSLSTECRWATMLGTLAICLLAIIAPYSVKHLVHVLTPSPRRGFFWSCCSAWNWPTAPTKLSCRDGVSFPCSVHDAEGFWSRKELHHVYVLQVPHALCQPILTAEWGGPWP